MADFDDWNEGDTPGANSDAAPQINGGLLDPRTFPAYLSTQGSTVADGPVVDAEKPQITGPLDTDVHAEVLQDILDAQSKLPPISLDRAASIITGPLRTDIHTEAFQNVMNAQAGLPPVKPGPETWSVNGQPYRAISASTFDPAQSNHLTSMPTPEQSAAAFAGKARVAVPEGDAEKAGFISQWPSRVVSVGGKPGSGPALDTYSYFQPLGFPPIHGHIDQRPPGSQDQPSDGFVDSTEGKGGLGDAWSLAGLNPEPLATVSRNRIGWHVLDDGQLKFLYPTGSMNSSQIGQMQMNLDDEQNRLSRPR